MSRLDNFIARMQAQRILLNQECAVLNQAGETFAGPIVELGLGNGRTYHHLKEKLVDRRIVVFERAPQPNERSWPPAQDLYVGEIIDTAKAFAATYGAIAALVHADLGDGSEVYNADLRNWLPHLCVSLLRAGGTALSSTDLDHPLLQPLQLPSDVKAGVYFAYRRN